MIRDLKEKGVCVLETEEELVELLKQHGMLDKESAFKYNIQNV